MLSIFKG